MANARRVAGTVIASLLALAGTALGRGDAEDTAARQEKQVQIRAETDRLVRRLTTTLRVMSYYQLDKTEEKQMLDEVVGTLSGLSREQMAEVIARLEQAARTPDETKSQKEIDAAYARHREIMAALKGLLARYDAVKDLEQAAERLDKAAKGQLELQLQNVHLAQEVVEQARQARDPYRQRLRRPAPLGHAAQHLADEQGDLARDVAALVQQLEKVKALLPEEQQERWQKVVREGQTQQVLDVLEEAQRQLRAAGDPRSPRWQAAADVQWKASGQLKDLARALRPPTDKLAALREARQRIEQAIDKQEALREEAQKPPEAGKPAADKKPAEAAEPTRPSRTAANSRLQEIMDKIEAEDRAAQKAEELGNKQTRLENDTRDTRGLLKSHAEEAAARIAPAEEAMRDAQKALRKNAPREAERPQEKAAEALREVKKELDRQIAEAEKKANDPLAALKNAQEAVEQILKEQKDAHMKAREAQTTQHPDRLPPLTGKQQDLAKRTEDVKNQPMPAQPEAKAALDHAARAMEEAAKSLKDAKGAEAVAKQEEAVKSLEEARKMLGDRVAEVEKRRDDLAGLEDAAKRLEELAKKETNVAHEARDMAREGAKPDTKDLSRKQGELTPEAKEVGKQLAQAAPEAAKHVDEGAKHMEGAKADLDRNQLPPAARQADQAAQKLKDAQKALAKAMDEKKGQEAADQAAMQPNQFDPANAAQQIAKALEQTQKAAEQSRQADRQMQAPDVAKKPNLAQLQKQVADQAAKMGLPKAKEPAADAAGALEKGDLKGAVEGQKKALGELDAAAKAQGSSREGEGTPKQPGDAQNAGQLAKAQEALMKATQAAARSQAANQAAMAALGQAQAQAPPAVQPQLQEAGKQLGEAGQQLGQGQPAPANQAQGQAAEQLSQALDTLNAAAAALASAKGQEPGEGKGQPEGQGQEKAEGQGQGQEKGQGQNQGKNPGKGQGQGQQPGKSQEQNQPKGSGNRIADGQMNNGKSQLADVQGDGAFLYLPPRQREMIRQALSAKLPPEYAALIQQYYVNIARGKPAVPPGAPEKR